MQIATALFVLSILALLLIPFATRAQPSSATTALAITSITGVQEGQSISGSVVIGASVAGDQVTRVTFRLSGPQSIRRIDREYPYYFMGDQNGVPNNWDTTALPDGDYTLKVTATNAAAQTSTQTRHFQIANRVVAKPTLIASPTPAPVSASTPLPTAQPTTAPAPTATPVPTSATANIFYVSTSGNDASAGTEIQPFRTLNKGASVLKPGDTLLVMPGLYAEGLVDAIPSGVDWSKPVTIKAYDPNNRPILMPPAAGEWVLHFQAYKSQVVHHIIVDGFVLDGKNVTYDTVKITMGANHIRLVNSEVRNSPNQGILTSGVGSDSNEFIRLDIHDNGVDTQLDHGMYISTSDNLIDGCLVHHNSGFGIQFYSEDPAYKPNSNIARNNRLYDGQGHHGGMVISSGDGNLVYNNLFYNIPAGIDVAYDVSNSKVYNNAIYGLNGGTSGSWSGIGIYIYETGASNSIYNNIISNTSGAGIRSDATGNTIIKNNLTYRNGGGIAGNVAATLSGNIDGRDPLFVDPSTYDFHLQAGSPAIDTGITLPEVPVDLDNVSRPQQAAFDIGVYEYHGH